MSIELLPTARLSPEVMLHMVLQKLEGMKGAIVITIDEHGAAELFTSQVTISDLAFAALRLTTYAQQCSLGVLPEGAEIFPTEGA